MNVLTVEQYPGLPKWPEAYVTGTAVTPEQAKEIIFRTDRPVTYISDYGFGNDRPFRERCVEAFGWLEEFAERSRAVLGTALKAQRLKEQP